MVQKLTIATVVSFGLMILMIVGGLVGNNPVLLMPAFLCAAPMFFFSLGAVFGRTSNEFQLVRKNPVHSSQQRVINPRRSSEPLG